MIYIVARLVSDKSIVGYRIFETTNEKFYDIGTLAVSELILTGMPVVNCSINNRKLKIKDWPNRICNIEIEDTAHDYHHEDTSFDGAPYIFIEQTEDNLGIHKEHKYKLIKANQIVDTHDSEKLAYLVSNRCVANCCIDADKGTIKSFDTVEPCKKDFVNNIDEQYNRFISKCSLLQVDNSFEYSVESQEVILLEYKGSAKDVIIPQFVTTIGEGSFYGRDIDSILLNDGLQVIGDMAFNHTNLKHAEIPKSVGLIGYEAFINRWGKQISLNLLNKNVVII